MLTDKDVTLVLAGAGSGKTGVIVEKVIHLVRDLGVDPSSILVLAYNSKAAEEIAARLPTGFDSVEVRTFHSFSSRVLGSLGYSNEVSKVPNDRHLLRQKLDTFIDDLVRDPLKEATIFEFLAYLPSGFRYPFDFHDERTYLAYVFGRELRTLGGELVKSFEELLIANFLKEQGIPYNYEKPYPFEVQCRSRRRYKPDFYLPEYDIYIEHFALDSDGKPPPGWNSYLPDVHWKRKVHQDKGTTLIETSTGDNQNAQLLDRLRLALEARGVAFNPVDKQSLIRNLRDQRYSWLANLLATFLTHFKACSYSKSELEERAATSSEPLRAESFLQIFFPVLERYQAFLKEEDSIDFEDQVNGAVHSIQSSKWENPYTYVLADEFQDISADRMELLKALEKPGLAFFLVGDDWQSIYRFTGSQVALVRDCEQHLGPTKRLDIPQTFRYGPGIQSLSSSFICRNPDQIERKLCPNLDAVDRGISLLVTGNPEEGIRKAWADIDKAGDASPEDTVLVLGRYLSSRPDFHRLPAQQRSRITFETVHAAKGLEADYVIILDLKDDRMGFPCKLEDDPVLDLVMPSRETFPFAEERRLFYVALTRARKGVYLIADQLRPSSFVYELAELAEEKDAGSLNILHSLPPRCPRCNAGVLSRPQGTNSVKGCSNHMFCGYVACRCSECDRGLLVINRNLLIECSYSDCDFQPDRCPCCRDGALVVKTNRTSGEQFLGCSNFFSDECCDYTERL